MKANGAIRSEIRKNAIMTTRAIGIYCTCWINLFNAELFDESIMGVKGKNIKLNGTVTETIAAYFG